MNYFHFKQKPQDFIVEEKLHNFPTWKWRFLYVYFEKKNKNTYDIIYDLKEKLGIERKHLWIAGIKDKHWITRQWISIDKWLFKKWVTKEKFLDVIAKNARILKISNDENMLKMWDNKWNVFFLRLRQKWKFKWEQFQDVVSNMLETIKTQWFPNYFGTQRFGVTWDNWKIWRDIIVWNYNINKLWKNFQTEAIFKIQAFASYLFNQYVFERMNRNIFDKFIDGDILIDLDSRDTLIYDETLNNADNPRLVVTWPMIWDDLMLSVPYEIKDWKAIYDEKKLNKSFELELWIFKKYWFDLWKLVEFQRFNMYWLRRPIKMYIDDMRYKFDKAWDLLIMFELSSWCYASVIIEYLDFLIQDYIENNSIKF